MEEKHLAKGLVAHESESTSSRLTEPAGVGRKGGGVSDMLRGGFVGAIRAIGRGRMTRAD